MNIFFLSFDRKRFGLFSFKTPIAVCDTLPEKPLRKILIF